MKKGITLLIMIVATCCSTTSAQKVEKGKDLIPQGIHIALHADSILKELKEIRKTQDSAFSMQYNAQKKRHEEIDSIRKASAGKGKSEIGIMAQIEDNTNEKFWSSGFTLVAILSFLLGLFTFWFQQKTERHTKNVSISSQIGVLKDLPRHFYRNLVCTVAIIIKYRHKDNRRGEYFKAYPSEANVMKLQTLPEEFILSIDTAEDDIYKEMHHQKLLFKNYNLEVAVASEHFSHKNMKEESLTNDYDNILYKPIALVKGIEKLYGILDAYNQNIWWKENFPKCARWMIKIGLLKEKQPDAEAYICNVINTFVTTHFDKLDFKKIRYQMQKTCINEIVNNDRFNEYIEYNNKQGVERSLNDLLSLYKIEGCKHFLSKEENRNETKFYIDIHSFKEYFFNAYKEELKNCKNNEIEKKVESHYLNIILDAVSTDSLLYNYGLNGIEYETAVRTYFECWRKDKCEVKELLYNMLKMDAVIELPIIGMIEHEG